MSNELFWYIFDGEPKAENGYVDLKDDVPGLGLSIKNDLTRFNVIGSLIDALIQLISHRGNACLSC